MLKFLLDAHLSPALATQVQQHRPTITIITLREWEGGIYLTAPDNEILEAAHHQQLTLVTYDQRTIPDLLTEWGREGITHSGVIFVDERRIAPHAIGRLVTALIQLWEVYGQDVWDNQTFFLR